MKRYKLNRIGVMLEQRCVGDEEGRSNGMDINWMMVAFQI
jgi:hypothetical protein